MSDEELRKSLTASELKELVDESYIDGIWTMVPEGCDQDAEFCECCTLRKCPNRKAPYDPMTSLSECETTGNHRYIIDDYWKVCVDCGHTIDLVSGRESYTRRK